MTETRRGFVYYLADERTPRHPRYVGSTYDPVLREIQHRRLSASCNLGLFAWKLDLERAGRMLVLRVVRGYATDTEAREAEWRLIRRWRRRGLCDLNTDRDGREAAYRLECEHRPRPWEIAV